MAATLVMDNPIFRAFLTYGGLVLAKTIAMSGITAYYRMTRKSFANEEDAVSLNKKKPLPLKTSEEVERVRRCHLNDLENVLPFVLLGLLYVATGPSEWAALLHFRIFTVSRFLHTIVYLGHVPQPARALSFLAGITVCTSMAVNVIQSGTF